MNKSEERIFRKAVINDLKAYGKNFNLHLGQEIANALTEEAHMAIKEFYSWHPKIYKRHYNFWHSYRKYHRNINGRRFAGVKLLLDEFPDDYRKQSGHTKYSSYSSAAPEDVFWRVYGFGWHGIASLQVNDNGEFRAPTMSPSPYERLINKRNEIITNQDYYAELAYKRAKKDKYEVMKFE